MHLPGLVRHTEGPEDLRALRRMRWLITAAVAVGVITGAVAVAAGVSPEWTRTLMAASRWLLIAMALGAAVLAVLGATGRFGHRLPPPTRRLFLGCVALAASAYVLWLLAS